MTGTPTRAWSRKEMLTPQAAACSMTMRLAMLPIVIRLPAKVLDTASAYHCSSRAGSRNLTSSMAAGTLLTRLLSATETPHNVNGSCRSTRALFSAAKRTSGMPVASRPWTRMNSAQKSVMRCQSTSCSISRDFRRRLHSSTPAAAIAVISRGIAVRNRASSDPTTISPFMLCQRSKRGSVLRIGVASGVSARRWNSFRKNQHSIA